MSDRDALRILTEAIHQVSLDCDDNTFGVLSLALEDANRVRDNPRRTRTFIVNLPDVPSKPQKRGWLQ